MQNWLYGAVAHAMPDGQIWFAILIAMYSQGHYVRHKTYYAYHFGPKCYTPVVVV